jgi:DNA mismatch repair protein MutL
VHPTKAEVRFRHQSLIHEVIRRAVADAIGTQAAPELQLAPPTAPWSGPVAQTLPDVLSSMTRVEGGGGALTGPGPGPRAFDAGDPWERPQPAPMASPVPPSVEKAGASLADVAMKPLMPLGQFRDTFIIAVDSDGVAIIDQHVAHERVLYERFMTRLTSGNMESQRLLTPLVLDLPPDARAVLLQRTTELHQCGFEIEEFGPSSVRVAAMPVLLSADQAAGAVRALAEDLEGLGGKAAVHDQLRQIAATMACHAAVKANMPLTRDKMVHILDELRRTAYSTVCPHGRPVMLRLSRREIEKNFQRI